MATTVAHGLIGISTYCGIVSTMPAPKKLPFGLIALMLAAVAANIPDLDMLVSQLFLSDHKLLHGGITHSFAFAAIVAAVVAVVAWLVPAWRQWSLTLAIATFLLVSSHVIVDWLTGPQPGLHPSHGLAAPFWPVSDSPVNIPFTLFKGVNHGDLLPGALYTAIWELILLGPVTLVLLITISRQTSIRYPSTSCNKLPFQPASKLRFKDFQNNIYLFVRDKRRRFVFLQIKYFCKFSFIHINKTGGSSIEKALHVPLIHETALAFRDRIGEKQWQRRFSFAIVRNPWDRAVSHFHYRRMTRQAGLADNPLAFKDWIRRVYFDRSPEFIDEETMFLTQADWVCDEQGKIMVDYIGRFENLQASWDDICKHLHRQKTILPHVKQSSRGDYRDYYDDESRKLIADFFRADIKLFNYSFE